MKLCQCCRRPAEDAQPTCTRCGEASWLRRQADVPPPDPEGDAPVSENADAETPDAEDGEPDEGSAPDSAPTVQDAPSRKKKRGRK